MGVPHRERGGSCLRGKIGRNPRLRKYLLRCFAADDCSLAKAVFFHAITVAIAPEFPGQALHFGVALRKVIKARRFERFVANDSRAVGD